MVVEVLGSSATWLTPRVEPKLAWMIPALPASVGLKQTSLAFSRGKFAPASVDFHNPYGGSPGARVTTPPLETELTPRPERADQMYSVHASTAIAEIARALTAAVL